MKFTQSGINADTSTTPARLTAAIVVHDRSCGTSLNLTLPELDELAALLQLQRVRLVEVLESEASR
jgi:hypothetical protein